MKVSEKKLLKKKSSCNKNPFLKKKKEKKEKVPYQKLSNHKTKNGYKNEKHSFIMPGDGECSVTGHSYVCFTFHCFSFQSKGKQVESCYQRKLKKGLICFHLSNSCSTFPLKVHTSSATANASSPISNDLISCFL